MEPFIDHIEITVSLISQPLQEVYQGSPGGIPVTIGHFYAGPPETSRTLSTQREYMAAVLALPHAALGTFSTAARGFGGETLLFSSHPELEKTHRIRGTEAARGALNGAVLDLLSREPDWTLEGKDDKLVIHAKGSPRARGLSVEEITHFVDGVFRIAELFGARFTESSDRHT